MRFYINGNDNILRHLYVGNCMREIERKMKTHVCIAKLFIAYMQCTFVASHIHFYCVCISNNGNKLHHRNVRELTFSTKQHHKMISMHVTCFVIILNKKLKYNI